MDKRAILVTGASGQIGREVVAQLRAANRPVRALTRHPDSAGLPGDVDVVCADLTRPDTLDPVLDGIDAVFLVWTVPPASAADVIARLAARSMRIVFLSAPIHTPHPFFQQPNPMRALHAGLEDLIEKSGARYTWIRPGPFALNCRNWWAPQISQGDTVRWFHAEAATAPVHEGDIAAVVVRALSDDAHSGMDHLLTGPESLTQREQLGIIGQSIGRPLLFEEVTPEVARRDVLEAWPAWAAEMLLSAYAAAVDVPALVTSTIEQVTGTPARTFRQWAIDHAAEFGAGPAR